MDVTIKQILLEIMRKVDGEWRVNIDFYTELQVYIISILHNI